MELTSKQKAFCDYYIQLGNATEAYKKAGYKNYKSSNVEANKTLNNPKVKAYIEERLRQLEDDRIAKADEVLKYLTQAMRGEIKEEVVVVEGEGDGCSSARTVRKEIGAKDRIKAAELLGKRYRLFIDKIEADVNQTVMFVGENELED